MATEHPILFSAPMIRALLNGTKSQTRRKVKLNDAGHVAKGGRQWHVDDPAVICASPYGSRGDQLWVRETWGMSYIDKLETGRPFVPGGTWGSPSRPNRPSCVVFRADGPMPDDSPAETARWSPSIHMPRWASRITLEITGVRVERLNSISNADAISEGVEALDGELAGVYACGPAASGTTAAECYRRLWGSINGTESWALNPLVWVVSFNVKANHHS